MFSRDFRDKYVGPLHVTTTHWQWNMADVDSTKALNGLLNGIAKKVYYKNADVTEELLKTELYPELSREEFTALHDKMRGLLKVPRTAIIELLFVLS